MTDKRSLEDYMTTMSIPKKVLKENTHLSKDYFQGLQDKIVNETILSLVKSMKKEYPEYPDEILTAFVKQFIDLELIPENNIRTRETSLKCIPTWKDVNMIDFNSEEHKLLDNYFMG